MIPYLTDQSKHFDQWLSKLKSEPVMVFDKSQLKEKATSITMSTERVFSEINLDFFFDYQVFPSSILTFLSQWHQENRKMRVGDTIVQQVYLPPTRGLSLKLVFGVRINNIIDEPARKGFSYETLRGHVEKGESTFTIEKDPRGLIFQIKTYSEPASALMKLGAPFFAIPYQAYCTTRALENVKLVIER